MLVGMVLLPVSQHEGRTSRHSFKGISMTVETINVAECIMHNVTRDSNKTALARYSSTCVEKPSKKAKLEATIYNSTKKIRPSGQRQAVMAGDTNKVGESSAIQSS